MNNLQHGMAYTPTYTTWVEMRRRCRSVGRDNSKTYAGIKVCERWLSFPAFLADVGVRPSRAHTLDRIDSGGNYEPGNVRWATKEQQSQNSRQVWLLDIDGNRIGVKAMARHLAMGPYRLYALFRAKRRAV